ncbi:MAG: hypothetical protein K2I81_01395 [Alphaproteobacteria bacterium]|nr:hypothetical protein [Alphaproteobacteria bacterium]
MMKKTAAKSDTAFHIGHRERLRQKFLDDKITDYEFLELLLSFAIPRRDVRPLARGLLQKYSGLHQICSLPLDTLMEYPGMGRNTAIFLKALRHAMLAEYREHLDKRQIYRSVPVLTNYCLTLLGGKDIEEFHVLYLDNEYKMLLDETHSVGTIDWSAVYPREIARRALNLNARSIVMLHNHPTAGVPFSSQDIKITTLIQDMLAPFDIELYDHFLVSGGQVSSARNSQLLNRSKIIPAQNSQNPEPDYQK